MSEFVNYILNKLLSSTYVVIYYCCQLIPAWAGFSSREYNAALKAEEWVVIQKVTIEAPTQLKPAYDGLLVITGLWSPDLDKPWCSTGLPAKRLSQQISFVPHKRIKMLQSTNKYNTVT